MAKKKIWMAKVSSEDEKIRKIILDSQEEEKYAATKPEQISQMPELIYSISVSPSFFPTI